MSFFLSHSSALELLRATPPQVRLFPRVMEPLDTAAASTDLQSLRTEDFAAFGVRNRPVEVLVHGASRSSAAHGVRTRRFGLDTIPAGLALEVALGTYAAGPELCFVQMARDLDFVDAVVLGCELCGRYSHFAPMVSGFYERPPLTSVEKIAHAIEQLDGLFGLGRAREALEWVRDGSRSPMETVTSCVLFLPARHRGLGFARPELNVRVPLDDIASAITGTQACYVDTAWPGARRGVEYDSREFHKDLARDLRRKEALQHMGWVLYSIDLDRMTRVGELLKAVALFADEVPRQPDGSAPPDEVAALHKDLLRATRFGLGLGAALFGSTVPYGRVPVHV